MLATNRFVKLLTSLTTLNIWWVLALALVLRVAWSVIVPTVPVSDSVAYDTFAQNLAESGVYGWEPDKPGAYWPIGTSAIYGLLYWIFGHNYWPIVAFNVVCSLGIVLVTSRLGARYFCDGVGSVAALILAVWPSLVFYVTVLASELPFMLLILLTLDVWTGSTRSIVRRGLICGFLVAGACYIRPVALLLPFVILIAEIIGRRPWKPEFATMAVTLLVTSLLIAPWTYRNFTVFGEVVLISTNGPVTFWMGNHPGTDGGYASLPSDVRSLGELERSKALGKRARENIREDPIGFLQRSVHKLIRLHSYETIAVSWNSKGITASVGSGMIIPLKIISQGFWLLMLALALAGIVIQIIKDGLFAVLGKPPLVVWMYFAAVHAVIVAQDRYHFPFIPFVAMFAALTFIQFLKRADERTR